MFRHGRVNVDSTARRRKPVKLSPATGEGNRPNRMLPPCIQLLGWSNRQIQFRPLDHGSHAAELAAVPTAQRPEAKVQSAGRGDVDDVGHGAEIGGQSEIRGQRSGVGSRESMYSRKKSKAICSWVPAV